MRAGLRHPRACEPLADAAKHRGCVGVGYKQASELALVVAFDEPDTSCARNDAQLVEPAVVALPRYRLDAATHDRFEQSHALLIGEINAASMLAFACTAD